jgi:C-terminal processing protease CtpA/Prc
MSAYTLKNPKPSVAVLVSRITASSGEAALIAFIGRENTRTFGEPTNGLPTVNDLHELEDGAALVITESYMADRNGTTYDDIIRPDQEVVTDWANVGNDKDEVLSTASRWLQDQPSCK